MKNKFLGSCVVVSLVLALGVIAFAVGQGPTPQKQPKPFPLPTADLQIKWIKAYPCGCDDVAAAVDAMILEGPIVVRVHNAGPQAADAKVMIVPFLFFREVMTSEKNIHLEKDQSLDVITFPDLSPQKPMLIHRSFGIKAEIKLTSGAAIDPNLSNNSLTINQGCQQNIE